MATAAAAAGAPVEEKPKTPVVAAASTGEDVYTGPKKVKVQTTDGKTVELDMEYMVLCQTLKGMCQSLLIRFSFFDSSFKCFCFHNVCFVCKHKQ